MTGTPLLSVRNIHATIETKAVLKGISLEVKPGEIHALMGPNGAGKSSFAHLLARKNGYTLTKGELLFLGEDLSLLAPEACAWKGLFLGAQYPVTIPGLSNIQFLKSAINAVRTKRGLPPLDAFDCLALVKETMAFLDMKEEFLYRALNEGFSGGEKKRNELLQMILLDPRLSVLDETDSGLDVDALKVVAKAIEALRNPNKSFILITHYQRLLNHIQPDFIHVLIDGRLVCSGDHHLAQEIEKKGYAAFKPHATN